MEDLVLIYYGNMLYMVISYYFEVKGINLW